MEQIERLLADLPMSGYTESWESLYEKLSYETDVGPRNSVGQTGTTVVNSLNIDSASKDAYKDSLKEVNFSVSDSSRQFQRAVQTLELWENGIPYEKTCEETHVKYRRTDAFMPLCHILKQRKELTQCKHSS